MGNQTNIACGHNCHDFMVRKDQAVKNWKPIKEITKGKEAETLNDDEVIIFVHSGCFEPEIFTIKKIKADTAHFYSLKHLYTDLLIQHRDEVLFKEIGNYKLKGKLQINQHGVEVWDFKVIDFKL